MNYVRRDLFINHEIVLHGLEAPRPELDVEVPVPDWIGPALKHRNGMMPEPFLLEGFLGNCRKS
jgi:hypothetical protein